MINWRGIPYYAAKSIFGSQKWRACLREVERSDIERLSSEYLRALLRHACEKVPYYQSLDLLEHPLADYPILAKEQLREDPLSFQRADLADHRSSTIATSGSTGEPLELLTDPDAAAWFEAADIWYLRELLDTPRWRVVSGSKVRLWHQREVPQTWSSQWIRLARFLAPRKWLDPYAALSEESLVDYARAINKVKPAFIWGFAGVLYELARAAASRSVGLHRPKFIISSGETLQPFMRTVIEEAFGCRVYDHYGSAEAGHVAGECRAGNLHVFSFASKVEVLDLAGHPVPPGVDGRLILTPLHNYAMPLIRYDTADRAEVGPRDCPCGCQLPTLRRISGRISEFFVTRSGSLISGGRFAQRMRHCSWILSFQILQEDIDQITVYFRRTTGGVVSSEDMEGVSARIADAMGPDCKINWQEVEEIPRTPNGKRPYARSLVWEARQPVDLWDAK